MKFLVALLLLAAAGSAFAADAPEGNAAKDITITAPTRNTDGSALTDLAYLTIYHGFSSGSYVGSGHQINVTVPGDTVVEPVVVNVVGNYGDEIVVYYAATASDERGNESAYSGQIQETYRIVDGTTPEPPSIMFSVPVSVACVTPDGAVCTAQRVG